MKIPARYSNLLFGGMLSIIMVTIISGTVVLINQGFDSEFLHALVQEDSSRPGLSPSPPCWWSRRSCGA